MEARHLDALNDKPDATTFRRRQRVQITHAADRVEPATIVRPDRALAGWYIVRFDDGAKLCVAGSSIAVQVAALAVD